MSALRVKNKKYSFVWHEGNPFVEVFRPEDPEWAPFEAVFADDLNYNESALRALANSPEFKE